MKRLLKLALPIMLLSVSACGFQPVYSTGLTSGSGAVQVDMIGGRTGHALRKALLRETAAGLPGTSGFAVITVDLDERIKRLALKPDGAAGRSSVNLSARYVIELPDDALSGRAESEVYFNVPREPFGDISAQNDAAERGANDLARRIVDDIRLQLANRE